VSDDDDKKPEKLLRPPPAEPGPPARPYPIMANPKGSIGFDRLPNPPPITVKPQDPAEPPILVGPPGNPKGNPMGRFPVQQELPEARLRPDPRRRKLVTFGIIGLIVAVLLSILLLVTR
jgi:hypothetical protein